MRFLRSSNACIRMTKEMHDAVCTFMGKRSTDECEAFGGWKLRVSSVAIKLSLYPTGETLFSFGESLSFHLVAGVGFEPTTFGL